jgi:hypothetical protein
MVIGQRAHPRISEARVGQALPGLYEMARAPTPGKASRGVRPPQIAERQSGGRGDRRLHLPDPGFDHRVAVSVGDRNAVVAVLDEVQLPDAVDVDRGQRLAASACRSDPLPPVLESVRARPKSPIELAAVATDGTHDRVQRDLPEPEVTFPDSSQSGHHFIEAQQRHRILVLECQARGEPRDGLATAFAGERRGGVDFRESNVHTRDVLSGPRAPTYGCAGELAAGFRSAG